MSTLPLPHFVRLSDLAQASGVHVGSLERYVYKNILNPDGMIEHGRSEQPIFLKNRLKEHMEIIRHHRESLAKESA
jgi:hypothetical protein